MSRSVFNLNARPVKSPEKEKSDITSEVSAVVRRLVRASLMDEALGLDDAISPKVASIIVHAGNIEHQLERAIWILEKINPKETRPETDAKPITYLIAMLERYAETVPNDDVRTLLQTWSKAT